MSEDQRLLEQLARAESNVQAMSKGVRISHPSWREVEERRKSEQLRADGTPQGPALRRPLYA
ncbi:MAG TPA: hypothetical protein VMF13_10945 [Luteitalea sp.]|nr:hypothetical protein [Luteitalea sp.]